MMSSEARAIVRTKARTPLELPLAVEYAPARPPLAIAHSAKEVPPWDWSRGKFSPWDGADIALVGRALELAALFEARVLGEDALGNKEPAHLVNLLQSPVLGAVTAATGLIQLGLLERLRAPLPPRLGYPRLVWAVPVPGDSSPPSGPLYPLLYRLGEKALRLSHQDPAFGQAVLETASRVGLLNPYGLGDSLRDWWGFSLEVKFYVDLMRLTRDLGGVAEAVEVIYSERRDFEAQRGVPRIAYIWKFRLDVSGRPKALSDVAESLYRTALPHLLPHLEFSGGRVRAKVGALVWVYLELSRALTDRSLRFCPVCGAPFSGRFDKETCRQAACAKAWYRKKKAALGEKDSR